MYYESVLNVAHRQCKTVFTKSESTCRETHCRLQAPGVEWRRPVMFDVNAPWEDLDCKTFAHYIVDFPKSIMWQHLLKNSTMMEPAGSYSLWPTKSEEKNRRQSLHIVLELLFIYTLYCLFQWCLQCAQIWLQYGGWQVCSRVVLDCTESNWEGENSFSLTLPLPHIECGICTSVAVGGRRLCQAWPGKVPLVDGLAQSVHLGLIGLFKGSLIILGRKGVLAWSTWYVLCYAMLCYAMLCYAMLCYAYSLFFLEHSFIL